MSIITTKFLPATNTRGARIKATCFGNSCTIAFPYELSGSECHKAAAKALAYAMDYENAELELVESKIKNGYKFQLK